MKYYTKLVLAVLMLVIVSGEALARKPVMAVAEFKNQSGAGWWRGGVGWELAGMLTNELASTGDFRLVERSKLQHVLNEQDLGASGRVSSGTAARMGKLVGAQYLVMGTVTSYEENTASTGGGLSFKGISIGGKKKDAYIAVDIRVVDSTTGEVSFVRTVEARAKSGGMSFGLHKGGFGGALSKEKKTPAGKAIRAVLMEITDYLGCVMVYKDGCLDEYGAKERRRREKTKSSISLD
ncbi:MAG: CsgG/HfaB family protein [bacterium]